MFYFNKEYSGTDSMDPKVREQGRLRAQEEHERKMKMLQDELERLRLQA